MALPVDPNILRNAAQAMAEASPPVENPRRHAGILCWRSGQDTDPGFSVSYFIITSHGGSTDVDSTPGRGACVRIELPG
jgi:hypothetical protein